MSRLPKALLPALLLVLLIPYLLGCNRSRLEGRVLGLDGHPLEAAQVAVYPSDPATQGGNLSHIVWSNTDGEGRFRVALPPGSYAVTASHPDQGWGNLDCVLVKASGDRRTELLAVHAGACMVEGSVTGPQGRPLDATVALVPVTADNRLRLQDIHLTRAVQGHFRMSIPNGRYRFLTVSDGHNDPGAWVEADGTTLRLQAHPLPAATEARRPVRAFIRENALPLKGYEPGTDPSDLQPLAEMFGSARVIGLGEACHGTHPLFRLKQRILEGLPTFTSLAVEMNLADAFLVEDYLNGDGPEPLTLLPKAFQTQEFHELINSLRNLRAASAGTRTIQFHGFDVDSAGAPYRWILAYLMRTDPGRATWFQGRLAGLETHSFYEGTLAEPTQVRNWRAALAELRSTGRPRKAAAVPGQEQARYERCLFALERFVEMLPDRLRGDQIRERAMADNLLWILAQEGPRGRILAWAHDGHISRAAKGRGGDPAMGWFLREALGQDYRAFGLNFGQGEFGSGFQGRPGLFKVNLKQAGTLNRALASAGLPVLALDFRRLPETGPVADWFRAPQSFWAIATEFRPNAVHESTAEEPVPAAFDGLLFVAETKPLTGFP